MKKSRRPADTPGGDKLIRNLFENPFYQATALINEMINLDYEYADGKIKIKEAGA